MELKKIIAVILILIPFFSRAAFAERDAERDAEEKIRGYRMTNSIDRLDKAELDKIHDLLTACADVMEFDAKKPDFDSLMIYILHSHNNFRLLTDIEPNAVETSPQSGRGSISLVGGEFIDYIVKNIFDLEPEHPAVSALSSRGFCYYDGYYYYSNRFFYYSTDNLKIKAVYDIGGGVYYIVFTDIYTENDVSGFEYSYAVIRSGGAFGYQILRIGMGLEPLSEDEVLTYAPANSEPAATPKPDKLQGYQRPLVFAAALVLAGLIAVIIRIIKR